MKELHLTFLVNVGLLSVAEIILLSFASADTPVPKNRCPKENPYPFRNQTFCCSRPIDSQWRKEGYCYGKSRKCTHNEGCVDYHPMCTKTESLLGIDFPLDEYNTKYDPTLIPTKDFSHKFLFKEFKESSDDELEEDYHCLWRDDNGKWILGLCKNMEKNIGHYFLDADSECPASDSGWKEIDSDKSVDGKIKDTTQRLFLGQKALNAQASGIKFQKLKRIGRQRVLKCLDWKKIPYINEWRCFKFFPSIKRNRISNKSTNKDLINRSNILLEMNEIEDNVDEVDVFYSNEMEQDSADTKNEDTDDTIPPSTTRYQEYDYSIDSIVYDIGL